MLGLALIVVDALRVEFDSMRFMGLNALFQGIDNAFQVYANHIIDK